MRTAGILLALSSLPSSHGIGTLGAAAYDFIDFLAAAGQSHWQILPPGPTGYGDSPYQSFSAFAGNPYYIDLDLLAEAGLLTAEEIAALPPGRDGRTDYAELFSTRFAVLEKAFRRQDVSSPAYRAFCLTNAFWLDDYALYMAIKEAHGQKGLAEWPEALRRRDGAALRRAAAEYAPRPELLRCLQFFFYRQWDELHQYARARGVNLIGDIPIYVADDSADLWANPGLFQLDTTGRPAAVAGVPPDAFSATGQLWGNPLYDWPAHKAGHYAWWLSRLRHAARLFDVTRIDHFRGFQDYYAIPAGDETAENGVWRKGPGKDFIRALHRALPQMRIIAEDLGYLTPEVRELLQYSGYPGMKVLQFAFDSREESDYLPHNYPKNTVVYTGTHDNTTSEAWAKDAAPEDVAFARRYLGLTARQSMAEGMIRAAFMSVADTVIVPLQDWLRLGAAARFNTPATLGGANWRWRLKPGQLTGECAEAILGMTRTYGRLSAPVRAREEAQRAAAEAERRLEEEKAQPPAAPAKAPGEKGGKADGE